MTNADINRPYAAVSPALHARPRLEQGRADYNALLLKFNRRFANRFSFANSCTLAKTEDLNSDNDGTVTLTNVFDPEYNRGPADYDVRHTFSSNWIYELPWAQNRCMAAGG